ncbi:MAG TPA: S41 family peptidase [Dokdonella sp.]
MSIFRRICALALSASFAPATLPAATAAPRDTVAAVATAIEQHYFDEAAAGRIGRTLRDAARKGEFDRHSDARDLAAALTSRLRPLNGHFVVDWIDPAAAPAAPAADTEPAPATDPQRRSNYGVREVAQLPGNIGYIDLREFADFRYGEPAEPGREAIEAALVLTRSADALVFDLRQNSGGSPEMVGYLSSAFIAKGSNIHNTFHGRDRTMSEAPPEWYASPRVDVPLYILISGRTGSAGEAFAYTLQNARRALVVGETSIGAANPGGPIEVGDGFSVFVSFATPINPISGRNWEGIGVQPDVAVPAADALAVAHERALETLLRGSGDELATTSRRWALEALRAQRHAAPLPSAPAYAGRYGEFVVRADADGLALMQGRRPALRLLALGIDRFSVVGNPDNRIEFERDANGAITALHSRWADGDHFVHRRLP